MPKTSAVSDADFIRLFEENGAHALSRKLQLNIRTIQRRRDRLEAVVGRQLTGPPHRANIRQGISHPQRIEVSQRNGVVLIGSDAHYWPGAPSTAHRAFVYYCKKLKPDVVILNGDVIDACTVSRHPPIGWEKRPPLVAEIEAAQERLHEIARASGRARKVWNLGNHDGRFETRIATVAPEYAKIKGVHLRDHFPLWDPAWSTWINNDVVVKHRFKGGIHAPFNNTIWAGKTVVTGHLHSAKVIPFSDYGGTRYGVDTGCIAETYAPAFTDYLEDNPRNWRSGFCVLTFREGELLMPELVLTWDQDHVQFRGELVKV